jgi:hypothetical protein
MKVCYWGIAFSFFVFVPSICLATDADQSLTRTYKCERSSVPPLRIESVRVRLDKSDAYIGGEVARLPMWDIDPHDYIEVSVIDPQGKVLSSTRTDYSPKPVQHHNSRSGNRFSSYLVKIAFIPPAFSIIKVVYVRLD